MTKRTRHSRSGICRPATKDKKPWPIQFARIFFPLKCQSIAGCPNAENRSSPVYPANARSLGQKGVVRAELLIDENGQVAAVQNLSGPMLLQGAAKDAVRKWKFRPFVRDGQPVKATGFLSFNFNL